MRADQHRQPSRYYCQRVTWTESSLGGFLPSQAFLSGADSAAVRCLNTTWTLVLRLLRNEPEHCPHRISSADTQPVLGVSGYRTRHAHDGVHPFTQAGEYRGLTMLRCFWDTSDTVTNSLAPKEIGSVGMIARFILHWPITTAQWESTHRLLLTPQVPGESKSR